MGSIAISLPSPGHKDGFSVEQLFVELEAAGESIQSATLVMLLARADAVGLSLSRLTLFK